MGDKISGFIYLMGILSLTTVHNHIFYLSVFVLLLILGGKSSLNLLRKTFLSVFVFNGVITAAYILVNGVDTDYILLINMRVFDMAFMTFLFISRVNLFKLVDFSKTLTYLLVVSYSQILLFRRYYEEFVLALRSRSIDKPGISQRYAFLKAVTGFFLDKSIKNSSEVSMAMKSRGFFIG